MFYIFIFLHLIIHFINYFYILCVSRSLSFSVSKVLLLYYYVS